MKKFIKYETFKNAILSIKKQLKLDNKYIKYASKLYPGAFEANLMYDNSAICTGMVDLLEDLTHDSENEWILYYIYDLNFGKKYKDGMITDKDNNNIKMKSIKDLYNFLKKNAEL